MASLVQIRSGQPIPKAVRDSSRYAQHRPALPEATLRALKKRGIFCQSSLTLEFQQKPKRYVLRGVESGGAVADMGRYCAYLDSMGQPLPWLQPIDSLGVNGRHAVVIAPEFVRIDMLRVGRTYELVITHHDLAFLPGSARPRVGSRILFRGQQGTLAIETWKAENKDLRGEIAPVFYTLGGEIRKLPELFESAVRRVSGLCRALGASTVTSLRRPFAPASQQCRCLTRQEKAQQPESALMEMTFAEIADLSG